MNQNQPQPSTIQDPDEINLLEYFYVLVKYKWWIISLTFIGFIAGHIAALHKGPSFVADAVIAPRETESQKGPNLSGLGAYSGLVASQLNMGGNASLDKIDQILSSRKFNAQMIDTYNLYPLIFPKQWDTTKQTWKKKFVPPAAINVTGAISGRLIKKTGKNNIMTLTVKSKDSTFSSIVLADYLEYLNIYIKQSVQNGARDNIAYLTNEMVAVSDPLVRVKIQELIANEYEKMMVVSKEAFVVLDPPFPSKQFKEKKLYPMVFAAGLCFMTVLIIVFAHAFSSAQKTPEDESLIQKIKLELFSGPLKK